MKEIKNLRKRNEKHFLNKDGSITCYLYDEDIHYLKNGQYENIDNTLIDNELFLTNKANAFRATFSKDKLSKKIVDITKDSFYLKIYLKTNKNSKLNLISQNNSISYKNILEDIDFDYQVISTKLKESIILKNKNNIPNCLAFTIDTNLKLELVNNKIIAKNENQTIFEIARPYMWDKENNYNYNISYDLKQVDSKYLLTLNLDRNWLKTANYPVVIDPTIVNKDNDSVIDTYIYPGDTNVNRNNTDILKVGVNGSNKYRTLLKFKLPNIGTASDVIYANCSLISHKNELFKKNNTDNILVHALNTSWSEETANWNNMNNNYDEHIEDFQIGSRSEVNPETALTQLKPTNFNITNLVKKWYSGKPNYGIMLKYEDETLDNNKDENTFYSKNNNITTIDNPKPLLIIRYKNQNGLEDYLSYKTIGFTDGSAYINNLTGNLTTVFNLNKTINGKYPVNLNITYNTNDVVLNNNIGYGLGLRLNFHETIKEETLDNEKYLEYIDGDSTIHYFIQDYNDDGTKDTTKYIDEDGLGLTATKENDQYIITDKNANKYIFTKKGTIYYLTKLIDTKESVVNITYNNQFKITKITDGNNSAINITYNTNSTIITSNYTTTTINYSNNKITSINTKNGTTNITYDSNNLIAKITDISGISNQFNYINVSPYKVNKVTEYGLNNEEGSSLTFDYGFMTTKVTDNKGRINTYAFNEQGNTLSINNLDSDTNINNAYGKSLIYYDSVGSAVIDSDGNIQTKASKAVNSLNAEIEPIKYTKNIFSNSSFENSEALGRYATNRTTEYARTGAYSYKINSFDTFNILLNQGTYTFSGYFKNNETIKIDITRSKVEGLEYIYNDIVPSNDEFKRYSFTFNVSNSSEVAINFDVNNNGVAYIDDIELVEGETPSYYNMLENGDFQNNLDGWRLSSIDMEGNNHSVDYTIIDLNNNTKALKIKSVPSEEIVLQKVIPIKGKKRVTSDNIGDIYNLSFWYKNTGINKNIASSSNNASVLLSFGYKDVPDEEAYDLVPVDLLAHNEEWQYFSLPFVSDSRYDYDNIYLNIFDSYNANELLIANISLSCDILNEYNWHNTDTGNLDGIRNMNGTSSDFKYDSNNQLTSMFNPKGNNFTFEYDNKVVDRVLKGISPTGISNEIKYDEYGNPIKTIINNVNPDNEIISGKNYHIRLKGTDKYLDCDFISKTVNLKEDSCSHDVFTLTKIGRKYYLKISNLYLIVEDNVILSEQLGNFGLYTIEKQTNGSYKIMDYLSDLYLCNNNGKLALSNDSTKEEDMEFYFEDIDTPLFIESNAEYTSDGKFLTKTVDSMGKTTTYDIDTTTGLTNSITDALENITNYTYNDLEQITKVTKNNKDVTYSYNTSNLLSKITSGTKNYTFDYDNFLNVKNIKINNNTLVTNNYEDNNGNLETTTYGNGSIVYYNYDELDRVKSVITDNNTYVNVYDNLGKLTKIKADGNEEYNYYYDVAQRLEKYKTEDFAIDYKYDANNNIKSKNYYDYLLNPNKNFLSEKLAENITYEYNKDDAITKVKFDNNEINYTYDYLGRLTSKDINGQQRIEYTYLTKGNKTSTVVKTMKINNDLYEYIYDDLYNITDIYLNNEPINHYEYDEFNQLIESDDYLNDRKYNYSYNSEGNIKQNQVKELSTDIITDIDGLLYRNANWEDQLTKANEGSITYDAIGNPLTIGSANLTWINGRQLASYKKGNLNISYSYNKDGIRKTKTVNNTTTSYFTEGNKIIFEKTGNNMIYYIRDEEGSLIGFKYNDTMYYYIKNMQEDIIGITDENFNQIVSYAYDPWGKIISIKDNNNNEITDSSHIGIINPFRYRSYYYDTETKLYYLNSRYYNPEWGRFINPDRFVYTARGMFSTNMYAYTENNPVNRLDSEGYLWFQVAGAILGAAAGIIANGIVNAITGRPIFDGWTGAMAGGAYYGLIATTPISYFKLKDIAIGSAVMNYGSSFINSTVNSIGNFDIKSIATDTIIGGSIGMAMNNPIAINKGWIRPTTIKTSFIGNYTKKLITNQVVTSMYSGVTYNVAKDAYSNIKNSPQGNKKEPPKSEIAEPITNLGTSILNIGLSIPLV